MRGGARPPPRGPAYATSFTRHHPAARSATEVILGFPHGQGGCPAIAPRKPRAPPTPRPRECRPSVGRAPRGPRLQPRNAPRQRAAARVQWCSSSVPVHAAGVAEDAVGPNTLASRWRQDGRADNEPARGHRHARSPYCPGEGGGRVNPCRNTEPGCRVCFSESGRAHRYRVVPNRVVPRTGRRCTASRRPTGTSAPRRPQACRGASKRAPERARLHRWHQVAHGNDTATTRPATNSNRQPVTTTRTHRCSTVTSPLPPFQFGS